MSNLTHQFAERVILHESIRRALSAIESTHDMSGHCAAGMLLIGESGLGKTTTFSKYLRDHLAKCGSLETPELTRVPILMISVPESPTVKSLILELLDSAGADVAKNETKDALERRLSAVVRNQKVELIMIDEMQHLLREEAQIRTRNVLNFLKRFMDKHKLAIVMAGLPRAVKVISDYEELYQRFSHEHILLSSFSLNSDAEARKFREYLYTSEAILADMGIKCMPLSESENMERILLATKGRPRLITRLITKAMKVSVNNNISRSDFIAAYNSATLNQPLGNFNPFSADADRVKKKLKEEY